MLVTKSLPAALPRTVGRLIEWKHNSDYDKVGVKLSRVTGHAPIEDLERAFEVVSYVCKPSDPTFIARCYGKADIACKGRAESSDDIELRSAVFVEQLAEFPNDIIKDAFDTWIRCEVFTPTIAQIRDLCWREYAARFGMKVMIKKMLDERLDIKARNTWMDGINKNNVVS